MLSKDKASFVLYTSFYDALQDLPLDRKGMLLDLIFQYEIHGDSAAFEGRFADLPNDVKMAFRFIKGQLDKDQSKWAEVCEARRKNGKRGADSRWGGKNGESVQEIASVDKDGTDTQPMATDSPNSKSEQKMAKIANAKFAINKIAKNGKAISGMAKMAEYEYDNEYDTHKCVCDNNACDTPTKCERILRGPSARDGADDAAGTHTQQFSDSIVQSSDKKDKGPGAGHKSTIKKQQSKFWVPGKTDGECWAALEYCRAQSTDELVHMARGLPRDVTIDGTPIFHIDAVMDKAAAYWVLKERKAAQKQRSAA